MASGYTILRSLLGYDQRGACLDIEHGQKEPTCNKTCTKRSDKTRGKRMWWCRTRWQTQSTGYSVKDPAATATILGASTWTIMILAPRRTRKRPEWGWPRGPSHSKAVWTGHGQVATPAYSCAHVSPEGGQCPNRSLKEIQNSKRNP